MPLTRRNWIAGAAGVAASARVVARTRIRRFTLNTAEREIVASIEYFDAVTSHSLAFQEALRGRRFCLSSQGIEDQNCVQGFCGSLALAKYEVKSIDRRRPVYGSLTESVRVIDKDSSAPDRGPYRRTIALIAGQATDLQVFGMQRAPGSQQVDSANDPAWSLLRQELLWDAEPNPFLVIHWKHTLPAIRLLDVAPVGATRILSDSQPLL